MSLVTAAKSMQRKEKTSQKAAAATVHTTNSGSASGSAAALRGIPSRTHRQSVHKSGGDVGCGRCHWPFRANRRRSQRGHPRIACKTISDIQSWLASLRQTQALPNESDMRGFATEPQQLESAIRIAMKERVAHAARGSLERQMRSQAEKVKTRTCKRSNIMSPKLRRLFVRWMRI